MIFFFAQDADDTISPQDQVVLSKTLGATQLQYAGMSHVGPLLSTRAPQVSLIATLLRISKVVCGAGERERDGERERERERDGERETERERERERERRREREKAFY